MPSLLRTRLHGAIEAGAKSITVWASGTPRNLLDISKIKSLGWSPRIPLREGIADVYRWFRENYREAGL